MKFIEERNKALSDERKLFDRLHTLLSYEKITFNDLHFRPFRTDEYIHKLFYETTRFSAFNVQWVVKARDYDDQRDPTQNCERRLGFQLVLKANKLPAPMTIHYMILKVCLLFRNFHCFFSLILNSNIVFLHFSGTFW